MLTTEERLGLWTILGGLHQRLVKAQAFGIALAMVVAEVHPDGERAFAEALKLAEANVPLDLQQETATFQQQIAWFRDGKKVEH